MYNAPDTVVAYVLAYRAPNYIRTQSLLRALHMCPNLRVCVARNRSKWFVRYAQTWYALLHIRKQYSPRLYILGFRGHEIFWPVRWLTRGNPLIFDALMSPSTALREEGKVSGLTRLLGSLLQALERRMLQHADLILTDTEKHAELYVQCFGVKRNRILTLPMGAIEIDKTIAAIPSATISNTTLRVLFFGSFLPLHGLNTIIAAAAQLRDLPIHFDFIGGKAKQAAWLKAQCARHGIVRYTHRRWVPLDELVYNEIPRVNVCLGGPFGDTPQARRVVTAKAIQCLALGKPTIVGAIDDDCGFDDKHNCLLVKQGDADALADALRWCHDHREALPEIGRQGMQLYHQRFSVRVIAERLRPVLSRLLNEACAQP